MASSQLDGRFTQSGPLATFTRNSTGISGRFRLSRIRAVAGALLLLAAALVAGPPAVSAGTIPEYSTTTIVEPGAYIVDMGVQPQTYENGLLPYGLIYELLIVHQIPVEWVISDTKLKDGVDFTHDGKDYRGGPFVITADYADVAAPIIASWAGQGVVVDGPTGSAFQAPVLETLTNWPNAVLDAGKGGIAQGYYEAAGIPEFATTAAGTTKTAYQFLEPSELTECHDIYVMPHADPEWETHQELVPFNESGGYIWAACHAVSVLENVADPGDPDPDPEMNFLSTNGLIDFGDHDGGSPAYSYRSDLGSDPINQFIGVLDNAQQNGSEQIYVPAPGSAWRGPSTVLGWDPDQSDLISQGGTSPGEAASLVYGRGFGDDSNGLVMYEGGHSHDKGDADAVAAIRAFMNFHLLAGLERGLEVTVDVPEPIVGGSMVDVSATINGGSPDYTYTWTSSCGGGFATTTGTSTDGNVTTQFTAPDNAQGCVIRLLVSDTCGRTSFAAGATEIVEIADLSVAKTDGVTFAESGSNHTYTITVSNNGPGVATDVTVDDVLPNQVGFLTATPTQGSCFFDGTSAICNLGSIPVGGTADITIETVIDDDAAGTMTNTATVSAPQLDPNPDDNTAVDTTEVGPNGLRLEKSAAPDFIDAAALPADVTFTFLVTNEGPNELTNVTVSDSDVPNCTPTFVGGDTDGDNALDPGEIWEYNCTVSISADLDNNATAGADDPVIGPVTATAMAHVETISPDLSISKGPDNAQHSDDGDVAFEIVVTNSGDVDLVDLSITDPTAPGCDRFIGSLPVGASISYYCSISPAPAAGTSDVNTITATAEDPGGQPVTATDDAPFEIIDRDLGITKTPIDCATGTALTDPAYYPGDTVCYKIVVTNTGTTVQDNVTLTDALPNGVSLVDTEVIAPIKLISDDFNRDAVGDVAYPSGLTEYNDNDQAKDGDVSVSNAGTPDCATGNQCLEIKAEDVGIQWQTDLSGASAVDVAFDWVIINNDDVDGFFDLACWNGTGWTEIQQFTIEDDTTVPSTPSSIFTVNLSGLSLPAGCQIAGGAIGIITDGANNNHEFTVDNLVITAGAATLTDTFEDWDMDAYYSDGGALAGTTVWAEFDDDDPAQRNNGDVWSVSPDFFDDCETPGDCALGITKSDVGIYWPADYSSSTMCTISFDYRVFASDGDGNETFIVGGIDAGGAWVPVDTISAAAPTAWTPYSRTFDSAITPDSALFHAVGGLGVVSGPEYEDKDQLELDNISIACINSFTTTANPDVVTAADDIDLNPGGTIEAIVTATVDAPGDVFPRELANLAQTSSDQQPTPSEAVATIDRVVPLIELDKAADQTLIGAGDLVTYQFTVTNAGNEPLENVDVVDSGIPGCTPIYVSGDTNNDGILDLTEEWLFDCTAAPPTDNPTFVNTATASGDPVTPGTGEAIAVTADGQATVEVINSGIEVVKSVDRPIIRPDEFVTYSYDVTLAAGAVEDLISVAVVDDQCSPVVGPNSGDDGDGVLEDGEIWTYTCDATLAATTTNIVTAQGTDRAGVDVIGLDSETVIVIEPAISLNKTADPSPINIGDTVTYTIEVVNDGNDVFTNVNVSDSTCSPLVGPTGDNGDDALGVGEIWTYTCTATPSEDTSNIADVTGTDSLGKTWNAAGEAFVDVLTPSLAVSKVNDGALIFPDEIATYSITVFNDGDSDFTTVTVTDPDCSPLNGPLGDDGDGVLSPDEAWFYNCATPLPVTTKNTITVAADGPGGPVGATDSSTVRVHDPQLDLTKTASDAKVDPGTAVTYDFTVTNTGVCDPGDEVCEGDHELQSVVVTDDHCAVVDPVDVDGDGFNDGDTGGNGPDGIMEIGEAWLFTCTASVDSPTTNTASATAQDVLGDTVPLIPPTATAFVDVTADPVLDVAKSGPAGGRVGDTVTYTFDVTNSTDCSVHPDPTWCAENSWVESVTLVDDVAGPVAPVLDGSGTFNLGDVNTDDRLDVGEIWQFTVDYVLSVDDLANSPLVNTGTMSGTDRDGDTVTADGVHSTAVQPALSDLSLTKSADIPAPLPGDVVTFTIEVDNAGPSDALNVAVQDLIPGGLVVDGATISDDGVQAGSIIDWSGLTVTAGDSISLTYQATVQTPTGTAGEFDNAAQITASDSEDPNSAPNNDDGDQSEDDEALLSLDVQTADLGLTKAISNPTPNVGELVTFTLTVNNFGPDQATNVSVADVVPAGYTGVTNVSGTGILDGTDTVTWSGLTVDALGSVTLTFDATVAPPTGTGDEYTNVAEITAADQWDPNSTPDNDDGDQSEDDEAAVTAVPQVSDLSLVKTSSDDSPDVGDVVTFTLTVTNDGPDTATTVQVTDTLPAGLAYMPGSMIGGSSQNELSSPTLLWGIDSIGSVSPDNTVTLTYEATVVAVSDGTGGLDATAYLNAAEITAADQYDPDSDPTSGLGADDGGDGVADDDESPLQLVPTVSDLSIAKASAATPQIGEVVTVTLTVDNDGTDDATNIEVVDLLPLSLVYQLDTIDGGDTTNDVDPTRLVWTIDLLPAGTSVDLTYDVLVAPPTGSTDEYRNQAEITQSDQWDPDSDVSSSFADDDLGDGAADDDETEFTVDPQVADIEIDKIEPATPPNVGDVVTYQIVVTNLGPDTATNVDVTDTLPPGLTYQDGAAIGGDGVTILIPDITWTIGTLPADTPVTLEYQVLVEAPTGTAGEYANVAEVTASDQYDPDSVPGNDDATEDDYETTTIVPQVADLSLTKAVDPTGADVGDTLAYTLTLTNLGPATATGVVVEDQLPIGFTYNSDIGFDAGTSLATVAPDDGAAPSLAWTVNGLEAGETLLLTYTVTIDAPLGAAGEYTNVAQVAAADQFDPDSTPGNDDGDQSEDDEAAVAFVPRAADLQLAKSLSDAQPNIGDVVTFTIELFNAGPDPATNVGITDVVPAGYSNVAAISGGGILATDTITWSIPEVLNGATITLTYEAEVAAVPDGVGGLANSAYQNVAQVTASDTFDPNSTPGNDDGDQSEDDEAAVIATPPIADLELVKTPPTAPVNIGDTVSYTLTLTNLGPDPATNAAISDLLPAGLTYVSGSIAGGSGQSISGDTLLWTVDLLPAGSTIDLTYRVTVGAVPDGSGGVDPAAYVNVAEVTASDQWDPDSAPGNDDGDQSEDDEASSALTPEVSDLSIAKASTAEPQVGELVTVTLTVTNDGSSTATAIEVIDNLPIGLVYQPGSMTGGANQNETDPTSLVWTIDSILAGDSAILEYVVEVQAPTQSTDEYRNEAEISGARQWDPDSDPASGFDVDDRADGVADDDEAAFVVDPQVSDLNLVKVIPADQPNVGDDVSYELIITNDGPDPATNVEVTDTLPSGLTYVDASTTGGVAFTNGAPVLTWTIDTLPAGGTATLGYQVTVGAPTGTAGEYTNTAEITGSDQFDPDSTPANGDTTEDDYQSRTIVPQQADLDVVKSTADTTPDVGDVISFTVAVTNSGPSPATDVRVTDLLPAGYVYQTGSAAGGTTADDTGLPVLAWDIDTISVDETVELTYQVEVVAVLVNGDVDPAAYTNQAEVVASTQFDPDSDPATSNDVDEDGDGNPIDDDEFVLILDPNVADVSLVKSAPVTTPNIGDVVTMTVTVSNGGPDGAEDLEIQDVLPSGLVYQADTITGGDAADDSLGTTLSWSVISLAAGASVELTYDVEVVAVADGAGGLDAAAYLNAAEVVGSTTFDPDSDPATGFAADDGGDGVADDDESAFAFSPQIADLSLAKSVDEARPDIGQVVTYSLVVTNDGPDTATGVSISDLLPAGAQYQPGSMTGGDTIDESGDPTLAWTISALSAGSSITLTYDAEVVAVTDASGALDPMGYDNSAQVTASDQWDPDSDSTSGPELDDGADGVVDDDESTLSLAPKSADVSLVKAVDDPAPSLGQVVTFTLTVGNDGPDPAEDLEIEDVLPAGFAYVDASIVGGDVQDGSGAPVLNWQIANLAAGTAADLTYQAVVVAVPVDVGGLDPDAYVNGAEITGATTWDPDSDPSGGFEADDGEDGVADDDETTVPVLPAVIGTAKSVGAIVNNGDGTYEVSYVLTIENMGLASLSDVTLFDDIVTQLAIINPTGFVATDGTMTANPTWDGTDTSNILADGQSLNPGQIGTAVIGFTVTPGSELGPHENVATAGGTTPTGGVVTDNSTDGTDPDGDGDDSDGTVDGDGVPDEARPTLLTLIDAPSIGVAKTLVGEPVDRFDGTFGLTFDITVENTGDIVLTGVQTEDDLSAVFAEPVSFEVIEVFSSDLTVNPAYDGAADPSLLLGNDELAVGQTGTVSVELIVSSSGEVGPFENQASASGTSPAGTLVSDLSQDGADVDPDGDGDPTNDNEPTAFSLPELGALTGVVWYDLQADGNSVGEDQLSDVRVVLVMRGPDGELGTDDDVEREDFTSSPYLFEAVPAGVVLTYVDTSTLPDYVRQTYDLDGSLDHATLTTVVAGQTTENVDFGYVEEVDLGLVKLGPSSTIKVGQTFDWQITLSNVGDVPARSGLIVTDNLPTGLKAVSASGAGFNCTVAATVVECVTAADLAPGDTLTLIVSTLLESGTDITNQVSVSANGQQFDANLANSTADASIDVEAPRRLAFTGSETTTLLGLAGLLFAVGLGLLYFVQRDRRRRTRRT